MKYVLSVTANPALDKIAEVADFKVGETRYGRPILLSAGGKGINVCRALKCLRVPSLATGFVGGLSGQFISRELSKEKIPFDFINISRETRTNLTFMDTKLFKTTRLLESGPRISSIPIKSFIEKFSFLCRKSLMVIISGSVISGAGNDFYHKLISLAHKSSRKVILDTSGPALRQGIKAKPFMIKPNRDEAEYILKRKMSSKTKMKDALRRFLRGGIENVCITLGAHGAVASNGADFLMARGPAQMKTHAVGCGDAFVAGFVASYLRQRAFSECVRHAVATATASIFDPQPGALSTGRLRRITRQVQITAL